MALLGLSILLVSISFLCYKNPPSTWLFLPWFRSSPSITAPPKNDAPAPLLKDIPSITTSPSAETKGEIKEKSPTKLEIEREEDADRKAMPPPPPPIFKKPSSPTTPKARASTTTFKTPSFTLAEDTESSPPPPSFPAINSAQRASGGISGPPRLNPLPQHATGLMAPSSRPTLLTLPPRGPPTANTGLAPPPTHSSIPEKPKRKVKLNPGHSPLDWARLTSSPSANLRGLPPNIPYLKVPPSLLKQMTGRRGKDAWTILGGRVYNISPYAEYHPGGVPELMKAAGRDGSKLFGEVHPWVNWEGMLEGCLIGVAVEEGEVVVDGGIGEGMEEMD